MNRIRHYRKLRGWTVRELAARAGYHYSQVYTWEKDMHIPSVLAAKDLAIALGVTLNDLFWEDEAQDQART